MSEYEYYIDYSVFGMNIVNEIEDELLLKFKIISEFIKEKGEIVDKNNKEQLYFLLGEEEYRGNWGRGVDVKVFLKSFLDKHQTISSMLCIFLKVISVFPPYSSSRSDVIKRLSNLLKDFYKIEEDKNAEYGYRVIPKHNKEIIQALENKPSLQTVMKYYYQNDIKKALGELRKITEFSSEKNAKFKKFIQSQSTELQEMCRQVYNFITNYENHDGKFADATETEARVWFDFGLSIYRLFTIYGDL